MTLDAQKSEVHESTDDSSTSPAAIAQTAEGKKNRTSDQNPAVTTGRGKDDNVRPEDLFPPGVEVRRDESDNGGPIEVVVPESRAPGDDRRS